MTPAPAAEVLRKIAPGMEGCKMGAEALELLHWWFTEDNEPQREAIRIQREKADTPWTSGQWVAAVRAEWEKERRT